MGWAALNQSDFAIHAREATSNRVRSTERPDAPGGNMSRSACLLTLPL